jgi:hypothetical protein
MWSVRRQRIAIACKVFGLFNSSISAISLFLDLLAYDALCFWILQDFRCVIRWVEGLDLEWGPF